MLDGRIELVGYTRSGAILQANRDLTYLKKIKIGPPDWK